MPLKSLSNLDKISIQGTEGIKKAWRNQYHDSKGVSDDCDCKRQQNQKGCITRADLY